MNFHPKAISATTIAAVVFLMSVLLGHLNHSMTTEEQGALTTILVGLFAYFTPSGAPSGGA